MTGPSTVSGSSTDLESRISEVLSLYSDRASAARAAGKSTDQIAAYAKGTSKPPFDALAGLAAEVNVSLDWLATGQGPMRRDQAPSDRPPAEAPTPVVPAGAAAAPASLDGALLGLCLEGLKGVYKDVGARIDDRSAGVLAARLYADVTAAADSEADPDPARRAALRVALQHLRRDLLRHDESGKHSA